MLTKNWIVVIVLLLTTSAHISAEDRFTTKLKLQTGEVVVVAEGDFEARSIGSFSVRLYEAAEPWNETTFYTSGLIHPRDGAVEKAVLADIDGDRKQEIVVIVRSVGSGGYLSAYSFISSKGKLIFQAGVEDLAANTDSVLALRKSIKSKE